MYEELFSHTRTEEGEALRGKPQVLLSAKQLVSRFLLNGTFPGVRVNAA